MADKHIFGNMGQAIDGAGNKLGHKIDEVLEPLPLTKAVKQFDAMIGDALVGVGQFIKGEAKTVGEPTKQAHAVAPEPLPGEKTIKI